jgi:hypothetical protein
MQLLPGYRIHISTELMKKSDIFRNIYTYTLLGIFYMCGMKVLTLRINGCYKHKQAIER